MVVERLSLDVEGGVGERRTKKVGSEVVGMGMRTVEGRGHEHAHGGGKGKGVARVEVRVDEGDRVVIGADTSTTPTSKPKKERKKVAFRSDKPDLYDF